MVAENNVFSSVFKLLNGDAIFRQKYRLWNQAIYEILGFKPTYFFIRLTAFLFIQTH